MGNKATTKPSRVDRGFFQELVAGLPTGDMGCGRPAHDSDVKMIIAVYEFIVPTTLSSGQNLYRIPSSLL